MGTLLVGMVVICVIGLAVYKVYKDRKNGKGCGQSCENCSCCPGCMDEQRGSIFRAASPGGPLHNSSKSR